MTKFVFKIPKVIVVRFGDGQAFSMTLFNKIWLTNCCSGGTKLQWFIL